MTARTQKPSGAVSMSAAELIAVAQDGKESGTAPSPAPAPAAQRMAVIEQAMKDSAGEYWKSPKLQDEYRSLIEAEDASEDHVEVQSLVGRTDLADAPADVVGNELMDAAGITDKERETWEEWTGLKPYEIAEGFANGKALWDGMEAVAGEGYQAIREAYTNEMPVECTRNIDRELCLDAPYYEPAGAEDMLKFRGTSAGALAVQGWGSQAEARLGILTARWDRMTENLSDDDFRSLDAFITNKLSPRERAWIWTALAT